MSKHTPGPWRADLGIGYEPATSLFVRENHASKIVAEVWAPNGGFNARSANARLIAAAPDLFHACEAMLRACGGSENWNGETHEALKLIESAISKARGESA